MKHLTTLLCLLLLLCAMLSAQGYNENKCERIVDIDSVTFYTLMPQATAWDTIHPLTPEMDGMIHVQTKDKLYLFHWENDEPKEVDIIPRNHIFMGRWRQWVLIEQEYLNEYIYFAINVETNSIDTLVGYPQIYGEQWLCMQSPFTDYPAYIEIWQIEGENAQLTDKFSLESCDIRINQFESYYDKKQAYILNHYFYAYGNKTIELFKRYENFYFKIPIP